MLNLKKQEVVNQVSASYGKNKKSETASQSCNSTASLAESGDETTSQENAKMSTMCKTAAKKTATQPALDSPEPLKNAQQPGAPFMLDLTQPILSQVYNLTPKQYSQLIHENVLYTTCSHRLFPHPVLEFFSRTPWFVVPLMWLPVSFYLLRLALGAAGAFLAVPILWFAGVFCWTLFEYIFHRFLFHSLETLLPPHGLSYVIHFTIHAIHHVFPMDKLRLVMPPALFFLLASPIFVLTRSLMPVPSFVFYAMWSGGVAGYVGYDMIHYASHHIREEFLPYLTEMRMYHMKHHFKVPTRGFGVTCKLWDAVFGTLLD